MKFLLICLVFFWISSTQAQQSFAFSVAQPIEKSNVSAVEANYYGIYQSDSIDTFYEFNEHGVWAISTIYSSISRETIRESTKYAVRNGYLFGVVENDSVPCFLEGEKYHFGIKHKEIIIGPKSKHEMKKMNNTTYIINFFEHGTFTPSEFIFNGKTLVVRHFDYENSTQLFKDIKIQNSIYDNNLKIITLTPTSKEWNKIEKSGLFGKKYIFMKN